LAGAERAATTPPPAFRWQEARSGTPAALEVEGLGRDLLQTLAVDARTEADWARVLVVYAEPKAETGPRQDLPAMLGTWRIIGERLRFEPRFPLARGVRYRAELTLAGRAPIVSYFELPPRSEVPTTTITQVYPSADVLPENLLKFYVQFSAPMSRGSVYEHVHVLDAQGRPVELPFLELEEELWDPAMTRLTLLIDPGRIKRGVKPLEDMGAVFESGRSYSLVFDAECRDAEGRALRAAFAKPFRIGPADREAPDPTRWKTVSPKAGTREPLVVEFGEPMDQALAVRLITVVKKRGHSAANDQPRFVRWEGRAELGKKEQSWRFTPELPWASGAYDLVVATTIEDLAGNNVGKTFDVDLAAGAQRRVEAESVRVAFDIK
jgi:hypothetical protein